MKANVERMLQTPPPAAAPSRWLLQHFLLEACNTFKSYLEKMLLASPGPAVSGDCAGQQHVNLIR